MAPQQPGLVVGCCRGMAIWPQRQDSRTASCILFFDSRSTEDDSNPFVFEASFDSETTTLIETQIISYSAYPVCVSFSLSLCVNAPFSSLSYVTEQRGCRRRFFCVLYPFQTTRTSQTLTQARHHVAKKAHNTHTHTERRIIHRKKDSIGF